MRAPVSTRVRTLSSRKNGFPSVRCGETLDHAVEERLRLAVDPMEVFEDDEDRLILGLPQEEPFERVQCALPALGRIEHPPGRVLDRHLQEGEKGRQRRLQPSVQRQDLPRHLLPHLPRVVPVLDLEIALEKVDDRQVGGRLPVGAGPRLHDEPPVGPVGVRHLPDQSRLPDARLPDEGGHLTGPRSRPTDGLAHLFQLRLPADEPGEAAGRRRVQPRAKWPSSRHLIEVDRRAQALDGHRAERRDRDEPFRETEHVGGQQGRVGLGQLLQARGQMRGLPDRRVVHPQIAADGAHDHLARVQADADLDHDTVTPPYLLGIATNRRLHLEGGVACPHGMILVGHRRPEEGHDPIAHHLVHRPLVMVDGLHHALEHRVQELPRLLGVPVSQELHRALEVREEDRHLLAFAFEGALRGEDLLREVLGGVRLG
jgi:hypothetical protein